MCGIAGYSFGPESQAPRTLAAQALLAGIAERGADAVGYAHRSSAARVSVHKQQTGASKLLESIVVPAAARHVLVHVRDYTKGHPTIEANNHPIRHGAVVGIHNGVIVNDEEIFDRFGFERAEPEMTVDSEAIFALAEARSSDPRSLEQLTGAMAAAWLDERDPETLHLARGLGRPAMGRSRPSRGVFRLDPRGARSRRADAPRWACSSGRSAKAACFAWSRAGSWQRSAFGPTARTAKRTCSRPSAHPHEGVSCLERLAAIAAVA